MLMIFVEKNLATTVNYDDVIEEFKLLKPNIKRRLEL